MTERATAEPDPPPAQPEDPVRWCRRGTVLLNQSRPADAVVAYRVALRHDPRMAVAWYGLACAHAHQGQHREALAGFQQAVRLAPGLSQAWYRLGHLHEHYEDFAEAIRAYRQAVRVKPDYAVAWYSLAVLCREEGQLEPAVEAFLQALRLRPHDTDSWLGLGITYAKQRNRQGVLDVYEELALLDEDKAESFAAQYVEGLAPAVKSRLPAPPPAREPARAGAGRSGPHPLAETWYEIGLLHRKEGRATEAISDFLEAVRFDPGHAKAWFKLAGLYRDHGALDEALQALRELLRAKPRLAAAWHELAIVHVQRGDYDKASKAFRRVVQLEPQDVAAWRGLGWTCLQIDNESGLAEVLEKLRALAPEAAEQLAAGYAERLLRRDAAGPEGTPECPAEPRKAPLPDTSSATAERPGPASNFDGWLKSLRSPASAAGQFDR